tara:strand:+ start:85033 stop:85443 length:411 start_codon:yes stop_codon:yes gene_type:complete
MNENIHKFHINGIKQKIDKKVLDYVKNEEDIIIEQKYKKDINNIINSTEEYIEQDKLNDVIKLMSIIDMENIVSFFSKIEDDEKVKNLVKLINNGAKKDNDIRNLVERTKKIHKILLLKSVFKKNKIDILKNILKK